MTNDEAKFILQAYRPRGQDAGDSRFAEALQQAQTDPSLMDWFNQNRAFDDAIGARMQSVPVPTDLRACLLAGRNVVGVPEAGWRQPGWLAVAAAFLVLCALGALLVAKDLARPSFASFQNDLPRMMSSFSQLEVQTPRIEEVRDWLVSHSGHADLQIPGCLEGVPSIGCRMLEWKGHRVTLVCFRVDRPAGQVAHLLVLDARELRRTPGAKTIYEQHDRWSTAAWSRGDQVYLLATDTGGCTAKEILNRPG